MHALVSHHVATCWQRIDGNLTQAVSPGIEIYVDPLVSPAQPSFRGPKSKGVGEIRRIFFFFAYSLFSVGESFLQLWA